eukprot:TRINITY_DN8122_c1_g1_i13.p1 TRINITY_DN8122_c1_g1~~TRINITY_DN8122_c1_g1_i13.p1  ORF type:complete len:655 (-),score=83.08 TRINITY_DN8122_c1_g1_i13:891-2789(-)
MWQQMTIWWWTTAFCWLAWFVIGRELLQGTGSSGSFQFGSLVWGPFDQIDINCEAQEGSFSRIVGGINVESDEKYPFLVSLQTFNKLDAGYYGHQCGGTLIADRVVLTAAHCLRDASQDWNPVGGQKYDGESSQFKEALFVAIGPYCRHQRGKNRVEVQQYYMNENYTGFSYDGSDIAILVLEDSGFRLKDVNFTFPNILASRSVSTSENLTIVGWGKTSQSEGFQTFMSTVVPLQEAPQVFYDQQQCQDELLSISSQFVVREDSEICARYAGETLDGIRADTCGGDSGGPLLYIDPKDPKNIIQVGITSWGPDGQCAGLQGLPGVYTRVEAYIDWIEDTLERINQKFGLGVSLGGYVEDSSPSDIFIARRQAVQQLPGETSPDNETTADTPTLEPIAEDTLPLTQEPIVEDIFQPTESPTLEQEDTPTSSPTPAVNGDIELPPEQDVDLGSPMDEDTEPITPPPVEIAPSQEQPEYAPAPEPDVDTGSMDTFSGSDFSTLPFLGSVATPVQEDTPPPPLPTPVTSPPIPYTDILQLDQPPPVSEPTTPDVTKGQSVIPSPPPVEVAPKPERCLLDPDFGYGDAYKLAYYFDYTFNACAEFIWSGRGGEFDNNFVDEESCYNICGDKPATDN